MKGKEVVIIDINLHLVNESTPLKSVLSRLNQGDLIQKILFVTKNRILLGSITDGDIRRWIINNSDLDVTAIEVANKAPRSLSEEKSHKAQEIMIREKITALPIVNNRQEILSIAFLDQNMATNKRLLDIPVVIMAGGLGSRLYPYTKILPKALIPVGEVPIVEHIINRFRQYGASDYHLILNHKSGMIKAYFSDLCKDYQISFYVEEHPLGTGGGLSLLDFKMADNFILTNCDILIREDYQKILEFHIENKNAVTVVCSVQNVQIPYGTIEINKGGMISAINEKPEYTFLTNTGMYIVNTEVLDFLPVDEPIDFPDFLSTLIERNIVVRAYPISEHNWLDMGQLDELEKMRIALEGGY